MFKIDKSLVENMSQKRSFIVITPQDTPDEDTEGGGLATVEPSLMDSDEPIPQAVRDKAREMLSSAQAKAQKVLQEAEARAEEIKEQARAEGFDTGMAEAQDKIAEAVAAQNEETLALIAQIAQYRDGLYEQLEDSVLPLALDIAEKIVNIKLHNDDRVYIEIAKKAVMSLKKSDDFVLRLGRGEFDKYFKDGGEWLREETDCGNFEVVCDPSMEPGDLVIESDDEVINAGVSVQLERARQYLMEQVGQHGEV